MPIPVSEISMRTKNSYTMTSIEMPPENVYLTALSTILHKASSVHLASNSAVAEVLAEAGTACKLVRVGVQDVFGESGKPAELFAKYKIDADAIVEAATK